MRIEKRRARTSSNREALPITCHECGAPAEGHLSVYFTRYPSRGKQVPIDANVNVGCPICIPCLKGAIKIRITLPKRDNRPPSGQCGHINGHMQCELVADHGGSHAIRVNGAWKPLAGW